MSQQIAVRPGLVAGGRARCDRPRGLVERACELQAALGLPVRMKMIKVLGSHQDAIGWGGKAVDRLAADLRAELPDQRGWSTRNLLSMCQVAEAWPTEDECVHHVGADLPWRHVTADGRRAEGSARSERAVSRLPRR